MLVASSWCGLLFLCAMTSAWSPRRVVAAVCASGLFSFSSGPLMNAAHAATEPDDGRPRYTRSVATGIDFYEYKIGDGPTVKSGDKVSLNYKGRLAGRQGWVYDDTFQEGKEPVRLTVGTTNCIRGLELGLAGDGADGGMAAMRKGGKRRLVIPARLGYTSTDECPIPSEFAQKQRLYSTVLNPVRGEREKEALGDSLAGKLVLDIELLRVSSR